MKLMLVMIAASAMSAVLVVPTVAQAAMTCGLIA